MSAVALARLTLSLAHLAPRSDVILSTHTPTVVAGFIAAHILRKGRLAWFYQDYAAMFAGRPAELWLMHHALRWHRVAFVNSAWAGKEISRQAPEKIVVTGVGVSGLEHFAPVFASERAKRAVRTIVTMGDVRERKGFGDFLAAVNHLAKQMSNLHLTFVSRESLEVATDLPFTLVLRPTRAELAAHLQQCDLFVLASRWESLGLPPLEAMACAAPVALVNAGGVRDYAVDGVNCLLVPPQDAVALADAMQRLLEDGELAQKLSLAGPPTAARYGWDALTEGFERELVRLVR
jgi:glycosyltransferase involved in cell wall biosynthesis